MKAIAASLVVFASLAAAPAGGPLRFSVQVAGERDVRATISGPEAEMAPGPFRGSLSINGSASELPISGTVTHAGGRWRLPVVVKYADVPAAWTEGFRTDTFTYRLRGSTGAAGAAPREWAGTQSFQDVEVAGGDSEKFLSLQDVRLTEMSLLSSEAVGDLAILNPLGFDVRIAEARYVLFAEGEQVGDGAARGMILHAGKKNVLSLPIEIDHGSLIAAAGQALVSGGDVAVRLKGQLVLRLKGGDVVVPLDLSGQLTSAS
jgi:LEA14-like dessication related protein